MVMMMMMMMMMMMNHSVRKIYTRRLWKNKCPPTLLEDKPAEGLLTSIYIYAVQFFLEFSPN